MSDRYLLCRPRGGLNDTLCRIGLCWQYASKFNRTLIIDCQQSSLFGDFCDFFEIIDRSARVIPALDDRLLKQLNTLPCRPAELAGRLADYTVGFTHKVGYIDASTGKPTRFTNTYPAQFVDDFPEPLLVYEDSGGGTDSASLLPLIRLAPSCQKEVRAALATLPRLFHAVHVRNTDYRTDYQTLFARIRRRLGTTPLLVCSDDPDVASYARRHFRGPVMEISRQTRSMHPTGALHQKGAHATTDAQRRAVIDSLVDLCSLASAKHLYYGPVHSVLDGVRLRETGQVFYRPVGPGWVSGFSLLARYLCENKKLLDSLLGIEWSGRCPEPDAVVQVDMRSVGRRVLARCRRRAMAILNRGMSSLVRSNARNT